MPKLAKGHLILLARKRGVELAVVVEPPEPPERTWVRAMTLEGKPRRYPTTVGVIGPIGSVEATDDVPRLRARLEEAARDLAARAGSMELDTLRAIAIEDRRAYSLDELADLVFDSPDPRDMATLRLALEGENSPFAAGEDGYVPLDDDAIDERRERLAREGEQAEELAREAARKRKRKRIERETLLPELRRILSNRTRPEDLSAVTIAWLEGLRAALIDARPGPNGDLAYGKDLVKIRDEGHAVQILARAGLWDPDREDVAAIRAEVALECPADVLAEARSIRPSEPDAESLLAVPTFTIDGPSTEDLDDAIAIVPEEDAFRVYVNIADVDRWISPGSALDRWGRERGESIYLPEAVHHLFPRDLVERISLNAGAERPAFTLSLVVATDGEIADRRFFRSIIRSDERLDYEEADARLADPARWSAWRGLVDRLEARRVARGAKITLLPDLEIHPKGNGVDARVVATDTPAHRLVAELMILFNEEVGRFFRDHGVPAIFKTQPPDPDGIVFPEESDPLYFPRVVRCLRPSTSGLDAAAHDFLGVEAYCQTTSPIRRYQDLVHQRQLAAVLAGDPPPYTRSDLEILYPVLDQRAGEVRRVERRRRRYWLLKHLKQLRGDRLRAIVSHIRPGGRPVVFFPGLLLETPLLLPPDLSFEVGDELFVAPQKVDPIRGGVWAKPIS